MDIFAAMVLKKSIVYALLVVFMMAKVEPVFPYLKQLPQLTHNLFNNISAMVTGGNAVDLLSDTDPCYASPTDDKNDEKEAEKEGSKSIKEECKMVLHLHSSFIGISTGSTRTLFHLYASGISRDHVNEVFRPPLV